MLMFVINLYKKGEINCVEHQHHRMKHTHSADQRGKGKRE